jgi:hypothetical protein
LRSCRTDVADPPGLPPLAQIKMAPEFDFHTAVEGRKTTLMKWQSLALHLPR